MLAITMPTTLVRGANSFFVNDEGRRAFARDAPGFRRTIMVPTPVTGPGRSARRADPDPARHPGPIVSLPRASASSSSPSSARLRRIRDAVRRCEDPASTWCSTGITFPLYGDPDGAHFECWTVLGAWPSRPPAQQIGALVTLQLIAIPNCSPMMARTVDHISGVDPGYRLGLEAPGPPGSTGTNSARRQAVSMILAAALPRITARLAKLNPAPTRHIPILIGGQGERRTLPLVARHADIWHGFTTPNTHPGKAALLDGYCRDLGRDPAAIERSAGVEDNSGVARGEGTAALLANAEALTAQGVTLLTTGVNGPDYDLTAAQALCRWRDQRSG